jgi:fructose-specific component phosphotransferase system IIB-like protein
MRLIEILEKEEQTSPTVYEIPAENMPRLQMKIAALNKKSIKIIGKPIELKIVDTITVPVYKTINGKKVQYVDADGNKAVNIVYKVMVDAVAPTIAGWTFVATIDHSPSEGNLIRMVPNSGMESVPEKYRSISPICDHCGKIRNRRDTYLLRNDKTGELKQIGRQCIKDFIPGANNPELALVYAQLLSDVSGCLNNSEDSGGYDAGGSGPHINVRVFLANVSLMISINGWVSKKDSEMRDASPTASVALSNMFAREKRIPYTEKDLKLADEAIEWAKNLPGKTDYEYNLSVLAKESHIEYRSTGMVASMIPGYLRFKEQEFKREEAKKALGPKTNEYIGNVGDRVKNIKATLYGFNSFNGNYGTTYLYKFRTEEGYTLVWFASEGAAEKLGLSANDAVNRTPVTILAGTVKKQQEYNGEKQTVLTRCKITSPKGSSEG